MATFFKVEFLFSPPSNNVYSASVLMREMRILLRSGPLDVRLCLEGNADSWAYLYVSTGQYTCSIADLRKMIEDRISLHPLGQLGVKVGTIYDIAPNTAVTPMKRTIQDVFNMTSRDLEVLLMSLWQETLQGEPSVGFLEGNEPILRTGLTTEGTSMKWVET
jgi:hypothetical protein